MLRFSFIIPVYNRPGEIEELLESFLSVKGNDAFEIVIVEDGSTIPCKHIIDHYSNELNINYFFKPNSGPGASRNYGMQKASGNYFIILDSDCLLPKEYFITVKEHLINNYSDCYGGADAAHESFTNLQKAINFTMTSFLTTGGIRGSKNSIQKFEPRSFNMGISKQAFEKTKGFGKIHPGEDPDLSQRILKEGFQTQFIPNAYVFHKRRISWSKFHLQVTKFGLVRPILSKWHPSTAKPTFWLPTLFILFVLSSVLSSFFISYWSILPLCTYILLIGVTSAIKNRRISVGILSICAVFVQFFGYGWAFLKSNYYIHLLGNDPEERFPHLFFK